MDKKKEEQRSGSVKTSLLIALVALISVTAAAFAWFSIADKTQLGNMRLDITAGKSMRFDLTEHADFEDYARSLSFDDIKKKILDDSGIDISEKVLMPLATDNGYEFTYENGMPADIADGEYIEFKLHFMSTVDMNVHLSSVSSKNGNDGTLISSENPDTPAAMRVEFFTDGKYMIYDPGLEDDVKNVGDLTYFALPNDSKISYNESNALFKLKENTDKVVIVRIWLDGRDENCTNDIKTSDYSIRLRFVGTDDEYRTFPE